MIKPRSPPSSSSSPTRLGADIASGQLVAFGEPAAPALREAANNLDDPDFAGRARQCLNNIEGAHAGAVSMAAARAVAALKPDGAADALLQFLPYAEDDKVEQEVESALAAVALNKDGKPEPAVLPRSPTPPPSAGPPPPSPSAAWAATTRRPTSAICSRTPSRPSASAPPWP